MNNTVQKILLALILPVTSLAAQARIVSDSVQINFRQSKVQLDSNYMDNRAALHDIAQRIERSRITPGLTLRRVRVVGAASPEGSVKFNDWLSHKRADRIFAIVAAMTAIPDSLTHYEFRGRDWQGLRDLAVLDRNIPDYDNTIALIDAIIAKTASGESEDMGFLQQLKNTGKGKPYLYMYNHIFPALRQSNVVLDYDQQYIARMVDLPLEKICELELPLMPMYELPDIREVEEVYIPKECSPFYMALKTNMLYDLATIPNVGVEFYLGKRFSVGANWNYAWWSHNSRHRYWRAYGGDISGRWWFGSLAGSKPLTGHHVGLYVQTFTYDFEFGGKGHMGGMPGRNIFYDPQYGGGVEYGFSLPIARRLNIDFTIGAGCVHGKVRDYIPSETGYEWQSTRKRTWWGPTKAEVSLAWLIGCDNYNRTKVRNSNPDTKGGEL